MKPKAHMIAYDESLRVFRLASRAFAEATNAYRARTIGDEGYLAARRLFNEAELAADAAEEAFIKTENESS